MNVYPNISYIAKLIAEPTRAIILDRLMDGRALPASELAFMAKVSHPTISSHLAKLVEGNLLVMEQHGRHRYYRLANEEVAEVIEKLGTIAPYDFANRLIINNAGHWYMDCFKSLNMRF